MGFLRKVTDWLGFTTPKENQLDPNIEVRNIMDDNGQTFYYDDEPRMDTGIGVDGQPMSQRMIMANSQINNDVSAKQVIPGQKRRPGASPRGRGIGQPQQMAPVPPNQQPLQIQPQYTQPVQPQYQQPQYIPQQQYPQYPPQYYQQSPAQYQQPQPSQPIEQDPGEFGDEPFSEFIMTNGVFHVYIDLPGVDRESIGCDFVDNSLVVSGERIAHSADMEKRSKGAKGKRPEFHSQVNIPSYLLGKFSFKFEIPKAIDESTLSAEYVAGQLHVTMSLRASVTGIKVSIK